MHDCSVLHYLQNLDTFILYFKMNQHYENYWVSCSLSWGKERGERARETLCFFDTFQDVLLSLCLLYKHYVYTLQDVLLRICLLYKHYILRLFIIQQPPVLGIFIFSPLKNSVSVGEMDLWLILSGYLMHSSILEALFWEVCFPPFELGKRPMKSAVQSTPIHNWERFKTNKINNSNNNTFEKIINASLFAPYYIYEP